ncbi:MAG: LOG family protein, partial [Candidatus Margulisiibacteriota bacterium]
TSVVYKLRQLGYHVKQIFCDIRGGFPNESSPDPDIDVFKLGFQMRQLAVISGQYIYVLPGGLGTNYELFQILTLQQLKKLGIDITSTNMNYDFKSITMVSHSGLFNDLNHHLDNAIRIGAVDASEMANIKSIRSLDKTNRD